MDRETEELIKKEVTLFLESRVGPYVEQLTEMRLKQIIEERIRVVAPQIIGDAITRLIQKNI